MERTEIPKLYQTLYNRAVSGKASPRQAIKAFCLGCCSYERNEITQCTDAGCELYRYRPYQRRLKRASESSQTPLLRRVGVLESTNSNKG